jgi:hypothetical protein
MSDVEDLLLQFHQLRRAEEHVEAARSRITSQERAIARLEHYGQPSAQSRLTLATLLESFEVMVLYRDHVAATYQTAALLHKLTQNH